MYKQMTQNFLLLILQFLLSHYALVQYALGYLLESLLLPTSIDIELPYKMRPTSMDKHGGKPQLRSFSVEEDLEERLLDK